jgi:hypothetical protein
MWTEYCAACKRPVSESGWSKDTAVSEKTEPTCMVMMSRNSNQELPPEKLSAAGRKPKLKQSLGEFSRAYSTPENPIDPTPENLESIWLEPGLLTGCGRSLRYPGLCRNKPFGHAVLGSIGAVPPIQGAPVL